MAYFYEKPCAEPKTQRRPFKLLKRIAVKGNIEKTEVDALWWEKCFAEKSHSAEKIQRSEFLIWSIFKNLEEICRPTSDSNVRTTQLRTLTKLFMKRNVSRWVFGEKNVFFLKKKKKWNKLTKMQPFLRLRNLDTHLIVCDIGLFSEAF